MSLLTTIAQYFSPGANGSAVNYASDLRRRTYPRAADQRDVYSILKAFYLNAGLYETLRAHHFAITSDSPHIRSIRNPVPVVVDYFGGHGFPKPLVVTTPTMAERPADTMADADPQADPLVAAIDQVHAWSNWQRRSAEFSRFVALYGEAWIKVAADAERGRVWFEVIEPQFIVDYEADERDYVTWVRVDVPKCDTDRETGTTRHYTRTEVWSKDDGTSRVWETEGDAYGRPLNSLGEETDESATLAQIGIDFLPFVRVPFREMGDPRGLGAVQIALEAVVEADLMTTNLHELFYLDADGAWVLKAVGLDANQRPLPPPVVQPATSSVDAFGRTSNGTGQADNGVQVGKRQFWRLGGNQELQSVVPDIAFDQLLAGVQDHDEHLERLMPALAYSKISEMSGGDLSGRAIRFKLTAAVDQVEEVRANLLAGLKQANMMALTLGQVIGLPEFRGLGTYESGALEHDFEPQEVLPVSDYEQAQTQREQASAMQAENAAGLPLPEILKRAGYSAKQIADVIDAADEAADQAMRRQRALRPEQPPSGGSDQQSAAMMDGSSPRRRGGAAERRT